MAREIVAGKEVRIVFDGVKCIHSRNWVLSRPDVFVPNVEGEWIHPERATAAEIAELAHQCPSGAIAYESMGSFPAEKPPIVNTVRVRENGPLAFNGALSVAGDTSSLRATLCRCGMSARKPYCDGAHATAGFTASGEAAVKESKPLEHRDGPLTIAPQRNGPLHVEGNLEIVTGTGHTINRVVDAWLCRCGQSANKPYCDGSHARAQFQADGA